MLFISLSEGDKRVIFTFIVILILIFALIGLIGSIIIRVMKWQGKRADELCHDVTVTRVIQTKKHFLSYGRKKNWRYFFKQSWIPICILLADAIFLIIYESTVGFTYNPFSMENGFGSLFFTWEISSTEYINFLGIFAFRKWNLTHTATFVPEAWPGYIFCPILIGAGAWYLVTVQCLLSRTIKIYKLSDSVFSKSLEGYNQNAANESQVNNQNNNNNTPVI